MMSRKITPIAAIVFASLFVSGGRLTWGEVISGWEKIWLGMSRAEVKATYPNAQCMDAQDTLLMDKPSEEVVNVSCHFSREDKCDSIMVLLETKDLNAVKQKFTKDFGPPQDLGGGKSMWMIAARSVVARIVPPGNSLTVNGKSMENHVMLLYQEHGGKHRHQETDGGQAPR